MATPLERPRKKKKKKRKDTRAQPVTATKELAFVIEFLQCYDATKAMKIVGLRPKSGMTAWRFLQRPGVQKLINDEMERRARAIGVKPERVVQLVNNIAEASLKDFATWSQTELRLTPSDQLTRDQCRCIKKITTMQTNHGCRVSIELYDATDALRLLMQYFHLIGPDSAAGAQPTPLALARKIRELVSRPLAEEEEKK